MGNRSRAYLPPGLRASTTVLALSLLFTAACSDTRSPAQDEAAGSGAEAVPADVVHDRILTIDAHLDIRDGFDGTPQPGGQFDLEKLEQGGLDVAVVALFADPLRPSPENAVLARRQVDRKLDALKRFVAAHPDRLAFVRSADEVEAIQGSGRHGILLGFLNAVSLGEDVAAIEHFYNEGVRVFGLTHAGHNQWADSSRPNAGWGDTPDRHGGLTALGHQAIAELNRLGIVIDVSQLTTQGLQQVIESSTAPVIASHSVVRGLVDNPRNLSDDELRLIADKGGVVHINAFASYLHDSPERQAAYAEVFTPFGLTPGGSEDPREVLSEEDYARHREAYRQFSESGWRYAGLEHLIDAVDYTVELIGIDHVGLSSDFNHGGGVVGWSHVGESGNVTAALLERGYSEDEVARLWGGNFLRVFREVEQRARR